MKTLLVLVILAASLSDASAEDKKLWRWEGFPLLTGFELTEAVVAKILDQPAR